MKEGEQGKREVPWHEHRRSPAVGHRYPYSLGDARHSKALKDEDGNRCRGKGLPQERSVAESNRNATTHQLVID